MIGIFDSGIGGASVLKEIIKLLPKEKYIYYSDSKNNPYGDKSDEEVYKIVNNIVKFLIDKKCKVIVIACNTASALCVKRLRSEYKDIIFIAIEPAYKMVYDCNFKGKTLVLATKKTLESEKFLKLYYKYDNNNTILKPCIGLAELIEKKDLEKIDKYLKDNLSEYKDIENVVLGCTHYSLIKENIKNVLGNVKLFDGNIGVSRELKRKLEENKLLTNTSYQLQIYDSNNDLEKIKTIKEIIKES